jgi:hypothetical protein
MTRRLESMGDCPFELHEGIKCDMLKFLKVSKVVSIFFKTYFQSILQGFCKVISSYQLKKSFFNMNFDLVLRGFINDWNFNSQRLH